MFLINNTGVIFSIFWGNCGNLGGNFTEISKMLLGNYHLLTRTFLAIEQNKNNKATAQRWSISGFLQAASVRIDELLFAWKCVMKKKSTYSNECTYRLWFGGWRTCIHLIFTWLLFFWNTLDISRRFCFLFEHFAKKTTFFLLTFLDLLLLDGGFRDLGNDCRLDRLTLCFDYNIIRLGWFSGMV